MLLHTLNDGQRFASGFLSLLDGGFDEQLRSLIRTCTD